MWKRLKQWIMFREEQIEGKCVTWAEGEVLIKQGWRLWGRMEDMNVIIGVVWLEKVKTVPRWKKG